MTREEREDGEGPEEETYRYGKSFRSVENSLFPVGVLCLRTC